MMTWACNWQWSEGGGQSRGTEPLLWSFLWVDSVRAELNGRTPIWCHRELVGMEEISWEDVFFFPTQLPRQEDDVYSRQRECHMQRSCGEKKYNTIQKNAPALPIQECKVETSYFPFLLQNHSLPIYTHIQDEKNKKQKLPSRKILLGSYLKL